MEKPTPTEMAHIRGQSGLSPATTELERACQMVEAYARSIGPQNEIIFEDTFVQVAPLRDAGDTTAPTLYEALTEAHENRQE